MSQKRRQEIADVWDSLEAPQPAAVPTEDPAVGARQSVLDSFAPPKKSRRWEREHPTMTIRGMDPVQDRRLIAVAEAETITKDWAANVLLHYAFYLHGAGKLKIDPQPGPRKMVLYPDEHAVQPRKRVWWNPGTGKPKPAAAKKPEPAKPQSSAPTTIVSYRLDNELRGLLKPLIDVIRTGDVIRYLLGTALEHYDRGEIQLVASEDE